MQTHHQKTLNPANAIGVMDSGVGGLSVLKHIRALMPNETLFYVADSLHAPYGNKSAEEIRHRCEVVARFLLEKKVKALVVACNTATAAAIETMRAQFDLPIIGMEPAVKPAAAVTKNGVVGVLATSGTLKSAQFAALLEHYGQDIKVVTQACVGLVECVERGELVSPATLALVRQYCQPLLDAKADTIVLGCTHYPFLRPLIAQVLQENSLANSVNIIDTGEAVAKQLQRRLALQHLLISESIEKEQSAKNIFWTNLSEINALQIMQNLWGASGDFNYARF
jgi:glutamate racemase